MSDRTKGIYAKFTVTRADGRDAPGEKHHGCQYFVLDVTHDPFAIPAMRAYADACARDYPALAKDIRDALLGGDKAGIVLAQIIAEAEKEGDHD